jgi:hypothetical protein
MAPTSIFSEISEEALFLHKQIVVAAEGNAEIKSLYKGCQLLFSPLLHKPKILLIGLNPGGGYFKHHGYLAENFEPMQALEYYLNKHSLGEQTKDLFRQTGREEDLKHYSVKTNFYFWATDNVADFNRLMMLVPDELSRKIFHQARVWARQMIEGLQPEMIVAEGFKAFEEIAVLFPQKLQEERSESVRSFLTPEGLKVLGYKRNQGSIIGKEEIIDAINMKVSTAKS